MTTDQQNPILDENHIIAERREKLAKLREKGVAFPNDFVPTHLAHDLHEHYDQFTKEQHEEKHIAAQVAGRMMLKRVMGKASFATVQDRSGQIQFYISDNECSADTHQEFKHWDMGDFIAAEGVLFKTNKGNYFAMLSYWRCKVDGSCDADRVKIFQDEEDFKNWLSMKSIEAFKNIFDLSQIEIA